MSNKRLDAVWRATKDLAERLIAARAAGLIVIKDDQMITGEIEIRDEEKWLAIRHEGFSVVLFDGREDGFGYFETIKEAREYFANRFVIAKPVKFGQIRSAAKTVRSA